MRIRREQWPGILFYTACAVVVVIGVKWAIVERGTAVREVVIARALEATGEVRRRSFLHPGWDVLAAGDDIYNKDELRTGPGAALRISYAKGGAEFKFGESTNAILKPSAIRVDSGTIESLGKGSHGIALVLGDVRVVFSREKTTSMGLKKGGAFRDLLLQRLDEMGQSIQDKEFQAYRRAITASTSPSALDAATCQDIWKKLDEFGERLAIESSSAKLSIDKDNNLKAQVSKGELSLKKAGEGEISLTKGQGLLVEKGLKNAKKIDMLPAVSEVWPADQDIIYNRRDMNFHWQALQGAESYQLVVSAQADLSAPLLDARPSGNAQALKGMEYDKTYYWKIQARDKFGFDGGIALGSFQLLKDDTPPKFKIRDLKF